MRHSCPDRDAGLEDAKPSSASQPAPDPAFALLDGVGVVGRAAHCDRRLAVGFATLAFLLLTAGPGQAAGTAATCAAAKQKAAAKIAARMLGCHSKALKRGLAVDPECLLKAGSKFAAAVARADSAGGCAVSDDAPSVANIANIFVEDILAATPVGAASNCAVAKQTAARKKASAKLKCHSVATKRSQVVDPACLADAESDFEAAFADAEADGGCTVVGDAAAIEGRIDAFVADILAATPLTAPTGEPGKTGPWAVGHRQLSSLDPARSERPLPLELWYPVDSADANGPFTNYVLSGPLSLRSELAHKNAPASQAGARPLVVFSHGWGGLAIQSVHLMEHLASHGFVVVAPNHTGSTTADFTGGTAVPIEQALLDRVPDISFVIDRILELAATPGDPLFGRIDPLAIGVAGHSLGGFTALAVKAGYEGIAPDPRVRAIMPIAPAASPISDAELANVTVPTFFMTGTIDALLADEVRAAGLIESAPFNYRADVIGAAHTHFANICDIADALIAFGLGPSLWPSIGADALVEPYNETCVPPAFPIEEATRLLNLFATAFFRRHLLGETAYDRYLTESWAHNHEPAILFVATP